MTITRGGRDFVTSDVLKMLISEAYAICADPLSRNGWFIATLTAIRYCDGQGVTLVAGSESAVGGFDGSGGAARFSNLRGMVCTSDRKRLFVTDRNNHNIRMIDIDKQHVTTVAGSSKIGMTAGPALDATFSYPSSLVFDRSPHLIPESVLWIVAGQLRRFDLRKRVVTTVLFGLALSQNASIDSTPSGMLIVANGDLISLFDTRTGTKKQLAGSASESGYMDGPDGKARFSDLRAVVVIDWERCAYVADSGNHRIRRVTLPSILF